MTDRSDLEARLAELIEHHVRHGSMPSLDHVTADQSELAALSELAERYLAISSALDATSTDFPSLSSSSEALPAFDGLRSRCWMPRSWAR